MKEEVKVQKSKGKTTTQKSNPIKSDSRVEKKEAPKAVKSVRQAQDKPAVKKDMNTNGKYKKTFSGTVVSSKMQNTVVVAIQRKVAHKLYRKLIKVTKRIKADTNNIDVKDGDVVVIEQTRPISKNKNFKVIKKEEAR